MNYIPPPLRDKIRQVGDHVDNGRLTLAAGAAELSRWTFQHWDPASGLIAIGPGPAWQILSQWRSVLEEPMPVEEREVIR